MAASRRDRLSGVGRLALGALASLLLAGCGHTAPPGARAATHAPTATATPLPPVKLDWQAANAPPGSDPASDPLQYIVAPSDARVTYGCGFTPDGARVWATRDGGHTWSGGIHLPYYGPFSQCQLIVDANNPLRVVAWLNTAKMGATPDVRNVVSYLSQDGGATWRALSKSGPYIVTNLTSSEGAIYAAGSGLDASGTGVQGLWVSHDGGATWRALDARRLTPNVRVWANPQTGELLGFNDFDSSLWRSADGGVSWSRVPAPALASGVNQSDVVTPHARGWLICAVMVYGPTATKPDQATCSADLGATWVGAPVDAHTQVSPKGFTFIVSGDVFAIAGDGSLFDIYVGTSAQIDVLRPGASGWAPLISPTNPDGVGVGYVYCSGPTRGAIWAPTSDPAHPFSIALYP